MTNAEANTAATVAEQRANVAGERASSKKDVSQKKGGPKGRKTANGGKTNAVQKKPAKASRTVRAKEANTPCAESKSAKILALIGRPKGATLVEITKAVGWQAHSVRGYLSTATKKRGIKIESVKNDAGERSYKLAN